jgi:hypothetical protein
MHTNEPHDHIGFSGIKSSYNVSSAGRRSFLPSNKQEGERDGH